MTSTMMVVVMMWLCDDHDGDDDYDNADDIDDFFDHKKFPITSNYYHLKHNIVPTKHYEYLHNHSTILQHHHMHTWDDLVLLGQEN